MLEGAWELLTKPAGCEQATCDVPGSPKPSESESPYQVVPAAAAPSSTVPLQSLSMPSHSSVAPG